MSNSVSVPNQGVLRTEQVYYTNKLIAGTAINQQVKVGYAVYWDHTNTPPNESAARGRAVTKCEADNLHLFAGIVTKVNALPTTSGGVVNGDAGWIEIAVAAHSVPAYTFANQTKNTTALIATADQWHLTASPATTVDAIAELFVLVGISLETVNTSSTAANARICMKGPGVTPS